MNNKNDNFNFFVPAEIIEKAGKNGQKEMIVQGVASTREVDRQGELLDPSGYDYSYFLTDGILNWHHQSSKDPSAIIGWPTECRVLDNGSKFFIKGKLFPKSEMAKKVYQLIQDMKGTPRAIGWSIEGKAIERDPLNKNKVMKARITGCALTHAPIGKNTYADVVKSFAGEDLMNQPDKLIFSKGVEEANGGGEYVIEYELNNGRKACMDANGKITIKKMLTTTSGAALKRESLESDVKPIIKSEDIYDKIFTKYPNITLEKAKQIHNRVLKNRDQEL